VPFVLHHAKGDEENKEVDGIEPREACKPEFALEERFAAVGIVVGKDVAGDEEEDANKDVAIVDEGIKKA
jgi:hypothetical protein